MSASLANSLAAQQSWSGLLILANNYGAKPGEDSTAAIQKAIDDAKAKGKREVYFQPGTYYFTTLTNTEGIVFVGDGVTVIGSPEIPVISTALTSSRIDNIKTPYFNQNKKRIALQLPICGPFYVDIITTHGYNWIYPQAFTIDERANEVLIVYSSNGGSNTYQWVSIFDWKTGAHKVTFSAGNGIGEGIAVVYAGDTRYLYLRGETAGYIARYDITTLPSNLQRLSPDASYNADLYFQFAERNGMFYVESRTPPTGVQNRRNVFTRFADDLTTRLGEVEFNIFDSGDLNDYKDYIPKRQVLAAGDGFFVGGYGAMFAPGVHSTITMEQYQGTKVFRENGECLASNLYSPDRMIDILTEFGIDCTRIENEGICVTKDNRVYSLYITLDATASIGRSDGIVIFEEFSNASDAIDFTNASAPVVTFPKNVSVHFPPRTQGSAIYNPVTGERFETLDDICEYMVAVDCREFQFYTTSAQGILDFNGNPLPNSLHVTIWNMNNNTFFYQIRSHARNEYFLVNGSPRVQTKANFTEVSLGSSLTPANNSGMVIELTNNTTLTFKVKGTDGTVRSATLTLS